VKILVLSHLFPNNVRDTQGLFVLERVRHMARHASLTVIAPIQWFPLPALFPRYAGNRAVTPRSTRGGLDILHPRNYVLPGLHVASAFFLCAALLLDRECRRRVRAAQVLDTHWTFPDALAAAVLGWIFDKPYVVTIRGHEAFYEGQGRMRAALIRACLRRAAGVIGVSEELRRKAIRLAGLPEAKTRTVSNGIDTVRFHPGDRAAARAALGLPGKARILLSIGRVSPGKGFHLLVEALPEVLGEHPDTLLIIVGEADPEGGDAYLARLRSDIGRLGLAARVRFVGKVLPDNLAEWYAACDCFCLASASEGSPNVVLEALACGRPVVATAVGGIVETLSDGALGLLVKPVVKPVAAAAPQGGELGARLREALARAWDEGYIAAHMRERDWDWCGRLALRALEDFVGPDGGRRAA
jgi:teichuronic acid biosynthesis glycosyltransferase TuaC